MKTNEPVTGIEHKLEEGKHIVSRTDLMGIITYVNQAFIDISGFSEQELLGQNHNIIRHPDMPSAAFQDLWDTIKAGNPWTGIVKNRCKNGDYYWVEVNVTAVYSNGQTIEYLSVRSPASTHQINEAETIYRQMNAGSYTKPLTERFAVKFNINLSTKVLLPIISVLIIMVLLTGIYLPETVIQHAVTDAKTNATNVVSQFKELRAYYTNNVIQKIIGLEGVTIASDHKGKNGVIPLPATMIHDLSEIYKKSGLTLKLYSDFPFSNRQARTLDAFQKDAWTSLVKSPNQVLVKQEKRKGRTIVRTAIADIMTSQTCVSCHNSHADSSKRNWQLGDVRGVLEVETDITDVIASARMLTNYAVGVELALFALLIAISVYLIFHFIIIPIKNANQFLRKISEEDFCSTMVIKSNDEMASLARSLKSVQIALCAQKNAAMEAIRKATILKTALDNVSSNVMVADNHGEIIYLNKSVFTMFTNAESEIQKQLPKFRADSLVGANIDEFHKIRQPQTDSLANLRASHKVQIKISGRRFHLTVNPVINEHGERLGTSVEWADISEQLDAEEQVQSLISNAIAGQLDGRIETDSYAGFIKNVADGINHLLDAFIVPVKEVTNVITSLSEGDLTQTITSDFDGEFAVMRDAINESLANLKQMVMKIRESASSISLAAAEMSQGNTDLSRRTEQQASNLEETAASMEELTSTVKHNAKSADQADQLAIRTKEEAELGRTVVAQAVNAMGEINTSSKRIADIIGVIDEIAFQTNLLALNAAVEAARAGEQGRGFAVVASEVRNLAGRSATAAKEIKALINDSVTKVAEGSQLVDESGKRLSEIVNSVNKVSGIVAEIAAASKQQSSGIEQVNEVVAQLDDVTQQNAAQVEQVAANSEVMDEQAQGLQELVGFFKIK